MIGDHCIKTWSNTQDTIALSSGEAEYYGIVRGASQGIGIRNMLVDLGINMKIRIKTDASAAKGIACRRGARKIRHIGVTQLWVQEKIPKGEMEVILTKHVDREILQKMLYRCGYRIMRGRHEIMPMLN